MSPTASAASESVTVNSRVGGLRSEPKLAVTWLGLGLELGWGLRLVLVLVLVLGPGLRLGPKLAVTAFVHAQPVTQPAVKSSRLGKG